MNNTTVITIEKNIPIPSRRHGVDSFKYKFLKQMDIGDSFVVDEATPDFTPATLRQFLYSQHAKKHNRRRYTVVTLQGDHDHPSSIRVWRVQ
tara:strand:+ start:68 stop:343 length:276 start_codon:yes stop_codon:yes gene_type:complete